MSDSEKASAKGRTKKTGSDQSPTPTRYERNLDAEIDPKAHDGGGPTEADTSDGSVSGDSNRIVAKEGSSDEKTQKVADQTKHIPSGDTVERNVEAENDSTTHTLDEKLDATREALESKRDIGPTKYGEPEGTIIREGEKIKVASEKNKYGQEVATEDVWVEQTYDGSARPSYKQVAVKGVPVTPWIFGAVRA